MRTRTGGRGEPGERDVAGPLRAPVIGAVVCAGIALAWLFATRDPVPLHPDTGRDLLLARSWVEGGPRPRMGAPASFGELDHGALWIHCLGVLLRVGGGVETIQHVLIVLHGLSAGVVFVVARRYVGPVAATIGALVSVPWMASAAGLPVLWNPSLAPLPVALTFLFAAEAIAGRRAVAAALSGLCFGMAIDIHMASAVIGPPLVGAFVASCRRPLAAASGFVLAAAVVVVGFSRDAVLHDVAVVGTPALVGAGGAGLAFVVVGAAVRARLADVSTRWRVGLCLGAAGAFGAAVTFGLGWAVHRAFDRRYFAVVVPVVAVAAGAAIAAIARWTAGRAGLGERGAVLLAALGGAVALQKSVRSDHHYRQHWRASVDPRRPGWSMVDVEVLAGHLYGSGWTFESARRRLHTPDAITVLGGLALFEPPAIEAGAEPAAAELLVVRTAGALLPSPLLPGWQTLRLPRGDVAVLRPLAAFLDRERVRVCLDDGAGRAPECVAVGREELAELPPRNDGRRAYPELASVDAIRHRLGRAVTTLRVAFEVGLVARDGEASHVISLRDDAGYVIERVDGWNPSGSVPGRTVVIAAADRPGSITFSGRFEGLALQAWQSWFPDWIETRADEIDLRRLAGAP